MDIPNVLRDAGGKGRECQVMSCDQSNGAASEQSLNHAQRAYLAIVRVGAVKNLVEEKQYRRPFFREIEDFAQAGDLGIKVRDVGLQRIGNADRGSQSQTRNLQ